MSENTWYPIIDSLLYHVPCSMIDVSLKKGSEVLWRLTPVTSARARTRLGLGHKLQEFIAHIIIIPVLN